MFVTERVSVLGLYWIPASVFSASAVELPLLSDTKVKKKFAFVPSVTVLTVSDAVAEVAVAALPVHDPEEPVTDVWLLSDAVATPVTWPLLSNVISCMYVLPELFKPVVASDMLSCWVYDSAGMLLIAVAFVAMLVTFVAILVTFVAMLVVFVDMLLVLVAMPLISWSPVRTVLPDTTPCENINLSLVAVSYTHLTLPTKA